MLDAVQDLDSRNELAKVLRSNCEGPRGIGREWAQAKNLISESSANLLTDCVYRVWFSTFTMRVPGITFERAGYRD